MGNGCRQAKAGVRVCIFVLHINLPVCVIEMDLNVTVCAHVGVFKKTRLIMTLLKMTCIVCCFVFLLLWQSMCIFDLFSFVSYNLPTASIVCARYLNFKLFFSPPQMKEDSLAAVFFFSFFFYLFCVCGFFFYFYLKTLSWVDVDKQCAFKYKIHQIGDHYLGKYTTQPLNIETFWLQE